MLVPQRIGKYLPSDEQGFIRADVSLKQIGERWMPIIDLVTRRLMEAGPVEAVYVQGSVPRGLAIEGLSDVDFLYVSETQLTDLEKEIEGELKERFSYLRGLELGWLNKESLNRTYPPQSRPYFHMLLKTQSLFLAGQDVTLQIAPFKVGAEMASHVFSLSKEFSKLPHWLKEDQKKGVERETHRWFSRRIVRSGLEVTLNRSSAFTRDLYLCYEKFAEFYPQHQEQMFGVLNNCLNGEVDPLSYGELVDFLDVEGKRLFVPINT